MLSVRFTGHKHKDELDLMPVSPACQLDIKVGSQFHAMELRIPNATST
jgi:hypothetical protein